jgi:signal transduction histidine kinase
MSLRLKLLLALSFAALLPMAVVVGLPMLQAERRAAEDASLRLELARHQVEILIERQQMDAAARLDQVESELASGSRTRLQPLLQGPAAAAFAIVRDLAQRYGLDHLECRNGRGAVLAAAGPEETEAMAGDPEDIPESSVVIRPLPVAASEETPPLAFVSRRHVTIAGEAITILGGTIVGAPFVAGVSEVIGEPCVLVGAAAGVAAGAVEEGRLSAQVPMGSDLALRFSVPAGDARRVRSELLGAFAGVAPFVVGVALIVGVLLGEGISRPIRALAERAQSISAERAGPLTPVEERNEVRRLTRSFDGMLAALGDSERQRVAAERVAAWEEVARRVAHEVRNPLTPIRMAVENLRRTHTRAPAEMDRALEVETATILEEVESLRRLVDEFSLFARLPPPQCVECDLGAIASQTLALFGARVRESGVAVEVQGGDTRHTVRGDPEQIGRALKNIVANALDAMESAPLRRLEIALRSGPDSGAEGPGAGGMGGAGGAGAFETIAVRDTGHGFAPDALKRVFEPYFTTRSERGGSGLGMAIVYRIAAEHGGTVTADAVAGPGAVVTLRLPKEGPPPVKT